MGVTDVHDAPDGASGLLAIGALDPDVVLLDWQMAGIDGPGFVRRVRLPDRFPYPNVPIIMLTGHGEHSRVIEAIRLGVHEFLVKPVSAQALYERLASVLLNPRPMVKRGGYYGPEPRKMLRHTSAAERQADSRMQPRVPGRPPASKPRVDRPASDVVVLE
jgi:DNA-binding response OmpR family regulator